MAAVLKHNRTITNLSVAACGIASEGATYLGYLLMENTALRALDLGWNEIGDDGLKGVATALQANATLHELSLNSCGITGAPEDAKKRDAVPAALEDSPLTVNRLPVQLRLDETFWRA